MDPLQRTPEHAVRPGQRRRRDDDDDDDTGSRKRRHVGGSLGLVVVAFGTAGGAVFILLAAGAAMIFMSVQDVAARPNRFGQNPPPVQPPIEQPMPQPVQPIPQPIQPIPQPVPPMPPQPVNVPVDLGDFNGDTKIYGGAGDPAFKNIAAKDGTLIGLELCVVNNNAIKAVRPIYRINDKEILGPTYGDKNRPDGNVISVKAKDDYALGGVTINAGLWIDGMSVTFMRVKDGMLDPNDSYQSAYYGGMGGGRTILASDGARAIGIRCKKSANGSDCTGFGLVVKR